MLAIKYLILIVLSLFLQACSKPSNHSHPENAVEKVFRLSSTEQSVDFGLINYKEAKIKTISIENDLSEPSQIVIPQITESNSSFFSIIYKNNCDKVLNPGEKCILKISVKNTSMGGNLSAQLIADQLIIPLMAQGEVITQGINFRVNNQVLSVLDFGVTNSKALTRSLSLVNTGKIATTVSPLSITNADFELVLDSCSNKVLIPNATCKIVVGFNPLNKNDGSYLATLNSGSTSISLSSVVEGGIKTNPTYDIVFTEKGQSLSAVNFGSGLSSISTKTIVVKNVGNTSILNPVPSEINAPYSIIYTSCDDLLAVNKTCAVKIMYNPKSVLSGDYSDTLDIGSSSIQVLSSNRPQIVSAILTGPSHKQVNNIYYSSQNLGQEVIPQVQAQSYGLNSENLTYKYSLNSSCSNAQLLGELQISLNQLNNIYVKVEDGNSSSDCVLVGSMVHDNVQGNISFTQPQVNSYLLNPSNLASVNYSFTYELEEINSGVTELFSYNTNNCSGTESTVSSLANLSVAKNGYKSVKVRHTDLAGNISENCSSWVYLVEPVSLTANLPSYTNNINEPIILSSSQATEMKVSSNSSCSDGTWESFSSSKATSLVANSLNTVYIQARREVPNLSACISVSTTHDNILPSINYNLSSDYTIPNPENATTKNYSYTYNLNEVNQGTTVLYSYNQALCAGTANIVSNFTNLVVPKLGYISVKVKHTDLAGNINEVCSPAVYLTQPILTSVEFENNPTSFAIGKKLQARKIVLKDQYDQVYTRTNHSVNILSSGVTTQSVPLTSGQATIYFTNNSVANKVGATLFKVGRTNNLITLEVADNPSIFKNQTITAHRKNCSELYLIDNIQNGDYTVDFDEEGPIAPAIASCHTANGYAWTTYASFVGNGVQSISASNQVTGANTDKYLQQTSFDALKALPYAYKADMNGITAFALDSDIPTSGTPCHDLRNNPAPGTYLSPNYYTYGHWETSGCNGVGGDYSGVFWDRTGTTSNTDVDGRASVKIWRIGALTNPLTTIANVVSNNNYLRMFITNKVYQYPQTCLDALQRDPTLQNSGTNVSYMIDIDGIGGLAPINAVCDFNTSGGGWTQVIDSTPTGAELALWGDTSATSSFVVDASYGISWGTFVSDAQWNTGTMHTYGVSIPHSNFKLTYTGTYNTPAGGLGRMGITNATGSSYISFTDGNTDSSSGQNLFVLGIINNTSTTNYFNRTDTLTGLTATSRFNISMHAYTSSYGYTRRYIKDLWVK